MQRPVSTPSGATNSGFSKSLCAKDKPLKNVAHKNTAQARMWVANFIDGSAP
jgi:hypothetical protein